MKSKQCPFCKGKAEIKPMINPFPKEVDHLVLYEFGCDTKGCYLQYGAGNYTEKRDLRNLERMWGAIPDWEEAAKVSKPVKKSSKNVKTIHYSKDREKSGIPCAARNIAVSWSDVAEQVTCGHCKNTKVVKELLKTSS